MKNVNNKWLRDAAMGLFVLVMTIAGTAVVANAQELAPEHLALAREYVDLTDTTKIFETTLLQAGVNSAKTILRTNPDISDKVDEAIGKTIKSYVGDKDQLLDQFARVYALRFSMDELKQILEFYKSPVGMKLTKQNGAINGELRRVIGVYKNNLQGEFFARVRANLKEMGIDI